MLSSLLASSLWEDIVNYFIPQDGGDAAAVCTCVMLWLAIALAVAFIACKFAVKKDYQHKVNVVSLIVALVYAAACIVMFVTLDFMDMTEEGELVAITFYPLLVFVIVCICGALAISLKPLKIVKIISACAICAALVAALVCMIVYFESGAAPEWNWVAPEDVNNVGLYISCIALVAVIAALAFLSDKHPAPWDSRSIALAAVCVAMSFALSYVKFSQMPMGGSITFASMLPVMLFSMMFGSRKGVIAGLIYGVLQAVQDPWLLHPAQFLLDYGVAFAAVGVAGCIKGFKLFEGNIRLQFVLGGLISGVLRFISHFFSGAFAFGSFGAGYADEYGIAALSNPYLYSLIYQSMYIIPEVIIVLVTGAILLSSKNFAKQVEKYSAENEKKQATKQA